MNMKDPEVIRMVNIVSQAVKVEPFVTDKKIGYEIPLDFVEEGMLGQLPTEGRILLEEYYKVLYLNNEDPEKYNFTYWEKYFNVSKVTLRNIFNHVFFPIPDEKNPTEIGRILYFKDIEFEKRRKMIAEMTTEEYNEYLESTDSREELKETNRLQYLEYQTTSTEPRITERTVPIDDEEVDRKIDAPLKYSALIKEIDKKIEELVKSEIESTNNINLIDKDVMLRMEELKSKRIEFEMKRRKEIEVDKIAPFDKDKVTKLIGSQVNNKL
jgi:hypothetical protein